MAGNSFPFAEDPQAPGQQDVTEAQWDLMAATFTDGSGVIGDPTSTALAVTPVSNARRVAVATGNATVAGTFATYPGATFDVAANPTSSARYDLVVLQRSSSAKTLVPVLKQGTAGAGVGSPDRTGTNPEIPLASVRVGPSATTIASSDVTDLREFAPLRVRPVGVDGAGVNAPRTGEVWTEAGRLRSWTGQQVVRYDPDWAQFAYTSRYANANSSGSDDTGARAVFAATGQQSPESSITANSDGSVVAGFGGLYQVSVLADAPGAAYPQSLLIRLFAGDVLVGGAVLDQNLNRRQAGSFTATFPLAANTPVKALVQSFYSQNATQGPLTKLTALVARVGN